MSRPRISINIGDYLRDTRGLHWRYQGPYLLLIFEYWTHGSLPEDDKSLARIVGMNRREWHHAKPVLMSYFGANWRHNRIEADLCRFAEKSMKAKAAASVSHSVRSANASKTQLQRAHAYLQERNISLPSIQNSKPRARDSKQAVAVQESHTSLPPSPQPTPVELDMPKDSDGVEITDEMRKASQQALIDMDTRDNPRARELEAKRNAVLKKNAPPEPAKPNPTSQEPDMLHNKIPISNELAASLTKPRPPANEDAILREWHAAGLEPQRLTNGQLMSLHLWRTLQEAQQKPTQTSSR